MCWSPDRQAIKNCFRSTIGGAIVGFFVAILTGGCASQSTNPVRPVMDASPTAIEKACANLATLKCAEAGETCASVLTRAQSITPIDVNCIANAKDVASVRLCPAITCK
jgi:hypothetical protein